MCVDLQKPLCPQDLGNPPDKSFSAKKAISPVGTEIRLYKLEKFGRAKANLLTMVMGRAKHFLVVQLVG